MQPHDRVLRVERIAEIGGAVVLDCLEYRGAQRVFVGHQLLGCLNELRTGRGIQRLRCCPPCPAARPALGAANQAIGGLGDRLRRRIVQVLEDPGRRARRRQIAQPAGDEGPAMADPLEHLGQDLGRGAAVQPAGIDHQQPPGPLDRFGDRCRCRAGLARPGRSPRRRCRPPRADAWPAGTRPACTRCRRW